MFRKDYNRRCFGCLVPQPRAKVKREAGDSVSNHIDGHSGTAPAAVSLTIPVICHCAM